MDLKRQKAEEYASNLPQVEIRKKYCTEDFEAGWDSALKNQWTRVEDGLPELNRIVVAVTKNNKLVITYRYMLKDRHGNVLNPIPQWNGSTALAGSIIAWMYVPL